MAESSPAALRWAALVRELDASELSLKVFAQRRQVNPSTLAWWRSRLRNHRHLPAAAPAPTFFEVDVVRPTGDATLDLRFDRLSAVLEIRRGTDLQWLRSVVDALC